VAGGSTESGRSVASRVTAILMAFRSGGTHSLSELAGLAGLPISTTHRLVGELVARRVLERTDDGYRVGLPLRMIGAGGPQAAPSLVDRGLVVIADLAEATRTAVRIGMLGEGGLDVAEADPARPAHRGFRTTDEPLERSALGRALLAFSPSAVLEDALARMREAGSSPAAVDQLRRILATTRLTRVAVRRDEHGAACALAVPVFGTGGTVLAALEAAVADVRADFEAVRSALLVAAGSLSRELATAAPWPRSDDEPDAEFDGSEAS
jgi:DNA-binding IclR family transcriptional regulator